MTDMIVFPLIVLSIRKVYPLHDFSQAPTFFLYLENQMNMILHQNIMVKFKLVLLFVSIEDLKILLIVNFIPEDILTIVSSGQNVKYMAVWSYPRYSWHTKILSILISHVKKIEPSLKFCHKKVVRKTAVGLACFRRGGRGKEKTGGGRALEFKEYKSL